MSDGPVSDPVVSALIDIKEKLFANTGYGCQLLDVSVSANAGFRCQLTKMFDGTIFFDLSDKSRSRYAPSVITGSLSYNAEDLQYSTTRRDAQYLITSAIKQLKHALDDDPSRIRCSGRVVRSQEEGFAIVSSNAFLKTRLAPMERALMMLELSPHTFRINSAQPYFADATITIIQGGAQNGDQHSGAVVSFRREDEIDDPGEGTIYTVVISPIGKIKEVREDNIVISGDGIECAVDRIILQAVEKGAKAIDLSNTSFSDNQDYSFE